MKLVTIAFGIAAAAVCMAGEVRAQGGAAPGPAEDVGVRPEQYTDKAKFLRDYVNAAYKKVPHAERNLALNHIGGVGKIKSRLRADGTKLWDEYDKIRPKAAPASAKPAAEETPSAKPTETPKAVPDGLDDGDDIDRPYLKGRPITGLFGIEFGSKPELSKYAAVPGSPLTYAFTPAKRFRSYSTYTFTVTPQTKAVHTIRARRKLDPAMADDPELRKADMDAVRGAFEKKFEKLAMDAMADSYEDGGLYNYDFIFPGADGKTRAREIAVRELSITAVDLALRAQADREERALRLEAYSADAEAL